MFVCTYVEKISRKIFIKVFNGLSLGGKIKDYF